MYTYTTTSTSHPSYKQEINNSSSSYTYTTTSTSSSSSANLSNENYRFTTTSDFLRFKNLSLGDDDEDEYENEGYSYEKKIKNKNKKKFSYTTTSTYNYFDNNLIEPSTSTSQTRECIICVETYNVNQFQKITQHCSHPNDICKQCVSQHIETQLNTKGDIEGILCPFGENCGFLIEYSDAQKIVSPNLFERYDDLSLKQTLRSMPDFRWCKNTGCGSGQIHSGGDKEPIMTCEACNQKSCYTHDIPWHDTLTCEEYNEAKKGEDMATQDLLDRETKKCPKCGVRITKNGGCNHMTCRVQNCRYEFCWLCLADYDQIRRNGNQCHKRTCQLYA